MGRSDKSKQRVQPAKRYLATGMTNLESIVIALAAVCGEDLATVFSEADIALIGWRRFPDRFGITGYERQHPDTKKVSILLLTKVAKTKVPLLERSMPGRWRLTVEGVEYARKHAAEAAA